MLDSHYDLILITCDPSIAQMVERCVPPCVRTYVSTPTGVMAAGEISAHQVWIDLDYTTRIPSCLSGIERRVYFYSRQAAASTILPPGLFLRKPVPETMFAMLWPGGGPNYLQLESREQVSTSPELYFPASLPSWLNDLHEIDLREFCHRTISILPKNLGYKHAALYLYHPNTQSLGLAEGTTDVGLDHAIKAGQLGNHLLGKACYERSSIELERLFKSCQALNLPIPAGLEAFGDEPVAAAVLEYGGQLAGAILLFGGEPDKTQCLSTPIGAQILQFVSRGLHFARLHDQVHNEARIDGLTGLYNYRWAMESLEREISRAERHGSALSVALVDLDGLKPINDRLGHTAGDSALRHVAGRIRSILRLTDAAARIGGDEFLVLLPGTDVDGARHVASKLIAAVQDEPAIHRTQLLRVNVSAGFATWQPGQDTVQLISAADQAMYEIKRASCEQTAILTSVPTRPNALR